MNAAEKKTAASERPVPNPQGSFLGAFRYRDFTLLWSGLLVGNIGTWMQFTALGYYVAKLAPNAGIGSFYIGLLGASRMVPVLIASPFAGVIADRYPRRRILLSTNVMTAILAVMLAIALMTDTATLPVVLTISAFQAATQSFDAPARQSWVPMMVPRELIGNAIGLNSFAFNAPSVVGPPLAGLLIAASGIAPCMILNAIVKFVVVGAI
ncbi:MAG TPA: MFS transporter, partial [Candidatus Aquilonibacter sp.]